MTMPNPRPRVYIESMVRRTSLELDEALLAQAQLALGTSGVKDTVEAAFHEVVRRRLRDRLAQRIASAEGVDLNPALLAEIRPTR